MAVKKYIATVGLNEKISEYTHKIQITLPKNESIEFQAGQFVNILVAPNARRSYSIGSTPAEKDYVVTFADTVAGGPGSQWIEKVKPGDQVEFLGPLGQFIYKENDKPVYFFATNTGLTPFISMIRHAVEALGSKRKIHLYLGFRHEHDIFGEDILKSLAEKNPNFTYKICISQPSPEWTGPKGRITLCIPEITETDFDAYICGSQGMINDVEQLLIDRGVPAEQIYYEQFY